MATIFFIDPQSYNNLGMYDYEILSRIKNESIYYIANQKYDYLSLPDIKILKWFKYGNYNSNIAKALSYIVSLFKILILSICKRPQVIHVQWVRIPKLDYFYYKLLKNLVNSSLVYTVHNILPHKIKKSHYKQYGALYKLCDILIVHTKKSKEDLCSQFNISPNKVIVVPHGPLEYHYSKNQLKNTTLFFSNTYNLKGKIVFGCLGTQSKYKGSDLILDAWCSTDSIRNNESVVLLLAGKFSSEIQTPNLPPNVICINRRISDLEFASILNLIDVIVLPYRRIEQSGVLLTAISHHIPYCATNVGELTFPFSIADVGWMIKEPKVSYIKETILRIINNSTEIIEKKNNVSGWKKVCDKYDWSKNAQITKDIYFNLSQKYT